MTMTRQALFVTSAIVCIATATPVAAQVKSFDIPAQSANSGIAQLGRQADVQIGVARKDSKGKRTNAVRGQMDVDQALTQLLKGTGLTAKATGAQTYTVLPLAGGDSGVSPETPAVAEETSVAGDEDEDSEIIVTAQKREERAQDVPMSLTAISGDFLQRTGAQSLIDYAAYAPGVNIESNGTPGQVSVTLRGISPVGPGVAVGTYINDTPLGSSSFYSSSAAFVLDLFPYDIERVEILRGPQGTLYGASTKGGLIKYKTRDPDLNDMEIRGGGDLSSISGSGDPSWVVRLGANVPIVADRLAVRASFFHSDTAGYIDNVATGEKDENGLTQTGGRVALLWQAADNVSLELAGMWQNTDSDGNAFISYDSATEMPLGGSLGSFHALPQPFEKDVAFYSATLNWDVGPFSLVSASSYSRTKTFRSQDTSRVFGPLVTALTGGAVPDGRANLDFDLDLEKFTQEVRLQSPTGSKFEWLVGAFYTHEDSKNDQIVGALDGDGVPVPGLYPLLAASIPSTYEEIAVFGDVTYRFSEKFDVLAGLRYSHNDQTFQQITAGVLLPPGIVDGKSSDNVLTYLLSPRYHFSDDIMVYGRIAGGYGPGGPNVALPGIPASVGPDRLVNYEVGLKTQFWNRVTANLSLFYIDWKDIQITQILPSGSSGLINGGTARSKGVELSTNFRVVRGLDFGFNAAYTDAKLTEDVPSVGGFSGDRIPDTPKWTASLTANYEFPLSGDWTANVGGGYRYLSARTVDFPTSDPSRLPAYDVLDLNAAISSGRLLVKLFARNLLDERGPLGRIDAAGQIDFPILQPRTIGIGVDFAF